MLLKVGEFFRCKMVFFLINLVGFKFLVIKFEDEYLLNFFSLVVIFGILNFNKVRIFLKVCFDILNFKISWCDQINILSKSNLFFVNFLFYVNCINIGDDCGLYFGIN